MEVIDKDVINNSSEFEDMNYDDRVNQLIEEGYQFKHGQYFSQGIEIFKKYPGGFIGFILVMGIINVILNFIPFIGSLINMVISAPLAGGLIVVGKKIIHEEPVEFGDFFKGFDYFLPLFLTSLLSGIIIGIATIFLILPGIYIAVAYSWISIFVIIAGKDVWDAMESSRKLITRKWWSFLGFLLLLGLFNLAGLLLLGVGVLLTAPISMLAVLAAFHDIVGVSKNSANGPKPRSEY